MILVTGASGFVGRELCRKLSLEGKARVRALFRHPAQGPWDESICIDLASESDLAAAVRNVDTVFHLAARTDDGTAPVREAPEFHRVNFEGTRRLFDAAAAGSVQRFVYASSVKAMGEKMEGRANEGAWQSPTTPYGMSKRAAESYLLSSGKVPHVSIVRASPVYGAGSKGNLARLIRAMSRGMFPPLPKVENARSMVHVEDLADALLLCAERTQAGGRVFIVTDGRPYATREMYEWICEAMGRATPRWSVPLGALETAGRLGDVFNRLTGLSLPIHSGMVERLFGSAQFDSSLIERTLGFQPKWDLRKALPDMIRGASEPNSR